MIWKIQEWSIRSLRCRFAHAPHPIQVKKPRSYGKTQSDGSGRRGWSELARAYGCVVFWGYSSWVALKGNQTATHPKGFFKSERNKPTSPDHHLYDVQERDHLKEAQGSFRDLRDPLSKGPVRRRALQLEHEPMKAMQLLTEGSYD